MRVQSRTGLLAIGCLALAILLGVFPPPVAAQTGPITTQSLFLSQSANAHRGDFLEVTAGLFYTDNVDLTPAGGAGSGVAMIGLVGDLERIGAPRFDYHFNSDLNLVKYFTSEFSVQPYGHLDAYGDFKIIPGLLSWIARDSFSQLSLDPIGPPTPDNIESLNYVTTGPQLTLKPSLRDTLTFGANYSYVYSSSKSPLYVNIDSHRLGGDAKYDHAFSSSFSAYITGSYQKVQFVDTTENTDFDYKQALVGFKFGDARTVLIGEVGYTVAELQSVPPTGTPVRLHLVPSLLALDPAVSAADATTTPPTAANQSPSGINWKVNLSRLISPTQRVSLNAISEVTDSANLYRLDLSNPVPGGGQSYQLATGQPFTYRSYGATWALETGRTRINVGALYFEDIYSQTPQSNRTGKQLNAAFIRELSHSLRLDLGLTYEHDDYMGYSQNTFNALTSLRWTLGPKVALRFVYAYSRLKPNGYTNNQVGITVSYALTTAAQTPDALLQPISPMSQPLYR